MINAMNFGLILTDRPYRDEVLDMDKSRGDIPTKVINEFRFVRICGVLMEQSYCCVSTGMATFIPVKG